MDTIPVAASKFLEYGSYGLIALLVLTIVVGAVLIIRLFVGMNKKTLEIVERNSSSHVQLCEAIKTMRETQERNGMAVTDAMRQLTIEVIKKVG